MLVRALLAAGLALLASGAAGGDAPGLWALAWPWLALFLALELGRERLRLEDEECFLAGAAAGLLYAGVYAKTIRDGRMPLGVDWFAAVEAAADGGVAAVLALHAVAALKPRGGAAPGGRGAARAALAVVSAAAALGWLWRARLGADRAERLLGREWLLADLVLAGGAFLLARRAVEGGEEGARVRRDAWVVGLLAAAVWLPGARLLARLAGAAGGGFFAVAAVELGWLAALAAAARRLRRSAGAAPAARRSRAALAALAWRVLGGSLALAAVGAGAGAAGAEGTVAALVDLPVRVLFAWTFLRGRLAL